jgi:hypothetical protein
MRFESSSPFSPTVRPTSSRLGRAERWDHIQARWAIRRGEHRVQPGLYSLGSPRPDSAVFVTANYTLSFDALRSALDGKDAYILVLDTAGINVWCAAGKGTFGTEELVRRMEACRLGEIVTQRVLILPQLGAPGVSAPEVRRQTGFRVEYGPILAADLPEYLKTRKASAEMRQVRFDLRDRLELVPVELVHILIPLFLASAVLYFLGGPLPALAVALAVLAGSVLFPILLPWLPFADFSVKGYLLGAVVVLPFSLALGLAPEPNWLAAAALFLALPPVTAFLALNFTGSTPFPSRSGVKHEIFAYIPAMAILSGLGVLLLLSAIWMHWTGRG